MPNTNEIWEIDVVICPDYESFPDTGDEDKLYLDKSTATTEDPADGQWYYWDGQNETYNFSVGPHPRPRP